MSYSIIIPTRNASNLGACLKSIAIQDSHSVNRVIVVDDDETGKVCQAADARGVRRIAGIQPFVFARNVNLGIAAAGDDDVVILNDDTCLLSEFGFGFLSVIATENQKYGIISAGITGAVGNPEQIAQPGTRLREAKHHTLVFVCVYLRRWVLDLIKQISISNEDGVPLKDVPAGYQWLDERFESYGYDDDDMCERVRRLGLKLGVYDGCVVEHGVLPSSYRGDHGNAGLSDLRPNRERFLEKWGFAPGQGPKPERER